MVNLLAAKQEILEWVAGALKVSPEEVDLNKPLPELGLDSLDAVHLLATIESTIRMELPETVVQRVTSLNDIFEMMAQRLAAA
ncbi:MAG: acyl carrier protein [Phycisphaerales bacterium]|nr:acyl carrier protein [Phycisphaerales bacterium]